MAPDASPLGIDTILQRMADAIPTHPKGDSTSDLSSSYEVLALAVHAYLGALGFRLLGFSEDNRIEDELQALAPRLPASWNRSFGSHSFVYAHKQSAMTFVIKLDRIGSKVEVRGLGVGDEKIHRFEQAARDVVKSAALPLRITLTPEGEEDRSDLVEKLRAVFVSPVALEGFLNELKVQIVQKLIPRLQREGYEEQEEEERERRDEARGQAGHPLGNPPGVPQMPRPAFDPPLVPLPGRGTPPVPAGDFPPPGFEDEYEMGRPPRPGGPINPLGYPGRSPFNIGHDDLNPPGLGPHDPLRGSFVPGGGLPRPGGGSGMHPTFDDPLFGGPGAGGFGGGGYDPQAPPGARWDPVGPGGPRFPGQGGPRGGNGGNPFGGGFGGGII